MSSSIHREMYPLCNCIRIFSYRFYLINNLHFKHGSAINVLSKVLFTDRYSIPMGTSSDILLLYILTVSFWLVSLVLLSRYLTQAHPIKNMIRQDHLQCFSRREFSKEDCSRGKQQLTQNTHMQHTNVGVM